MPPSKRTSDGGKPSGSRKVMVYVAPNVHRAMEYLAIDEDRSTSSVYVEAAVALLEARGRQVGVDLDRLAIPPATVWPAERAPELVEAIERQGDRIAELQTAVAGIRGAGLHSGQAPAGTKVAEAMKVVLGILKGTGAEGMLGRDLDAAARAAGVRSGTAETAKAVLRGAGVVRCEGKRWHLDGA